MKLDARGEGLRPQCPAGRAILARQVKAAGRRRPEFTPLVAVVVAATGVFFRELLIAASLPRGRVLAGTTGAQPRPSFEH